MDTVYSNKKYLQSLTAGSDFYRSATVRPMVSPTTFGLFQENAIPTANLVEAFNNIFDCLNSRHFSSKSPYEQPLAKDNKIYVYLEKSIYFLDNLKVIPPNENYFKFIKDKMSYRMINSPLLPVYDYLNSSYTFPYEPPPPIVSDMVEETIPIRGIGIETNNELIDLMKLWNHENLTSVFLNEEIDVSTLKIAKPHHIKMLFSKQNWKIGEIIRFEKNMEVWRHSLGLPYYEYSSHPGVTTSSNNNIPSTSQPVWSNLNPSKSTEKFKTPASRTFSTDPKRELCSITLEEILTKNPNGQSIQDYYSESHQLEVIHRNTLIKIIAQYFDDNDTHMSLAISYRLEREICEMFKGEKEEYYRIGSRGKLYAKYCNLKSNNRKLKPKKSPPVASSPNNFKLQPEEDAEQCIKSLKYDNLSTEDFELLWQACSQFRLTQIRTGDLGMKGVFEKWPQYKLSSGSRLANEYSSYQNTMGRRSTLGPAYTHMSKYSYPTDVSMSSHYGGYNSWGLWRDTRNISPSGFSTIKQQKSLKSFSIILLTAAFIVVLAVVSIAGLAFYFSTFKAEIDESILVFDGSFRVAKGDVYTTGLRYNQTAAFRQKAQFYEKLIKTAFESHDLVVTKCDILHFGDGPLIHVHFRVFLDMRQIPVTLSNVEQHIATALIDEISSSKTYKTIKVDLDTIEIKRLLDEDLLRSASFIHDIPSEEHDNFITPETRNLSQLNDKDKNIRKTGVIEKTPSRFQAVSKNKNKNPGINESEVDMENLPVIQGSFEVTKTDADITQRKMNSTTHAAVTTSTLKPFIVSPAIIKIKDNGVASPTKANNGMVEKVTTRTFYITTNMALKPESTTTTLKQEPSTGSPSTTTAIPINDLIVSTPQQQEDAVNNSELLANVQNPPKLDVNLFTSAPILDNEPWHPISPTIIQPMKNKVNYTENESPTAIPSPMEMLTNPFKEKDVQLRNNFNKFSEPITATPNQSSIYYKSFTNPGFSSSSHAIERLGTADLKPYPIPVNKIMMDEVPDFKYVDDKKKILLDEAEEKNKFDYIGGGVLVKKNHSEILTSTEKIMTTTHNIYYTSLNITDEKDTLEIIDDGNKAELATQFSTDLGELLLDLLEIHEDKSRTPNYTKNHNDYMKNPLSTRFTNIETTTITEAPATTVTNVLVREESEQPEFKNKETEIEAEIEELAGDYVEENHTSSYVEVETLKNTSPKIFSPIEATMKPTTMAGLYQDSLFPLHSKWEFVNGTLITPKDSMKKVFNSTLQALVVENEEPMSLETGDKIKILQRKNSDNIQNISAIFDNLASKLGIQPEISSKSPPYAILSQNKFKTNTRIQSKFSVRDKTPSVPVVDIPQSPSSSSEDPSTSQESIPILLNDETIPIVEGQAEIEEIDPQIYEEILKSESTSTQSSTDTESLVTLLPVKSNSGLRIFKRPGHKSEIRGFGSNFREAVVRTSVHVKS